MTCPHCKAPARSPEEHNTLFGGIGEAFANWPHHHKFKPVSAEHLRAWLLIEADWCDAIEIDAAVGAQKLKELVLFLCGGPYARFGRSGDHIVILRPKSLSRAACTRDQFRAISQRIDGILLAETGRGLNEYVEAKKRHAA